MKILIVTYNWPPRNAVGVHRPYAWAKYWSSLGESVQVLTAKKYGFDEPLDMELESIPNVDVIEVDYLKRARFFASILKDNYFRRLAKRIKNWLNLSSRFSIDVRSGWREASQGTIHEIAGNFDVVVSTFGPAASHLIACDIKEINPKIKWFADYRDLWSNGHLSKISSAQRDAIRGQELCSVGKHADAVTTVSSDLLSQLQDIVNIKGEVMPNGFDGHFQNKALRNMNGQENVSAIKIVYTGMIYRGHRDPTPLLYALERLVLEGVVPDGAVNVFFYGSRNEVAEELAENKRWAPFVRIMGHVDRDAALSAQQGADLLLLLESPDAVAKGVVPAKVYEYIFSGVPILSLGSASDSEIVSLLNRTGTGLSCGNDVQLIFDAIKNFYKSGNSADWYSPNAEEINGYTRENQAKRYLDYIKSSFY